MRNVDRAMGIVIDVAIPIYRNLGPHLLKSIEGVLLVHAKQALIY